MFLAQSIVWQVLEKYLLLQKVSGLTPEKLTEKEQQLLKFTINGWDARG